MNRIMNVLGNVAKHMLGSLARAIRMTFLTGIIVFIVVALATEGIAWWMTGAVPTGLTHLAAAALAIAFGYAAAVTVAIGEILSGIIRGIELIVAESEKLAQEGLHEVEGLARRGEEEALRLGRSALGEAGSLGRGVIGGAESLERGVASHLPGHHEAHATTIPSAGPAGGQSGR